MRSLAALSILSVLSVIGCAAAPAGEDDASSNAAAASDTPSAEPIPRSELPEPQAFLGWRDDTQLVERPRPEDAPRAELACADKHLYPTHPSSDRKRYHRLALGRFDHFKVDGASSVCKIKGTTKDPRTGLLRCFAADDIQYVVLSDTFEDSCGNFYRGFWAVSFLTKEESMGTLMSLGRTVYSVPKADFAGEVYDAQTYAVDASQLLFVSPLLDGDAAAIPRARAAAKTTHRYDASTHLWEYVGPHR